MRSDSEHVSYYPPPPPSASSESVQEWLVCYFRTQDYTHRQAEELAAKLPINGEALYRLDVETFKEAFGLDDGCFVYDVQYGRYGKFGVKGLLYGGFGLRDYVSNLLGRWWPGQSDDRNGSESLNPQTSPSHVQVLDSLQSPTSDIDFALPTGSSVHQHSGPRDARYEAIAQEKDHLGCHDMNQDRNGIRNRCHFNRDTDEKNK